MNNLGLNAQRQVKPNAGEWGTLTYSEGSVTLVALPDTENHAICKIPGGSTLVNFRFNAAALGATTGIDFVLYEIDGEATTVIMAVADTSGVTSGSYTGHVIEVAEDSYIAALQDLAGTASGVVSCIAEYSYNGK